MFVWSRVSAAPFHINTISFGLSVMLSLSARTKGHGLLKQVAPLLCEEECILNNCDYYYFSE